MRTERAPERELLEQIAEALEHAALAPPRPVWEPLPHQVAPDGDWRTWGIIGGRGSGKTRVGVEAVMAHLRKYGPAARVGIGAPTLGDAQQTCLEGQSGLYTLYGDEFTKYNASKLTLRHKGGGFVRALGSEKPQRWNGPQWTLVWGDELALWNRDSWDQAMFGLRLRLPDGRSPHAIVTTTPKAKRWVKDLIEEATSVSTHGSTNANPHLDAAAKAVLYKRYGGTKMGRQELDGIFVLEIDGALWTWDMVERSRLVDVPRGVTIQRIVIGVDPAVTSGENAAKTGIIVAAKGSDGHGYIFRDASWKAQPAKWARRVARLYEEWEADRVVGEVNNGGELVEAVLRVASPNLPYKAVRASRGKQKRAEPIAALYEQGRVHHVGVFPELEDQMTSYTGEEDETSPDSMDAMVWAMTDLMMGGSVPDIPILRYD